LTTPLGELLGIICGGRTILSVHSSRLDLWRSFCNHFKFLQNANLTLSRTPAGEIRYRVKFYYQIAETESCNAHFHI